MSQCTLCVHKELTERLRALGLDKKLLVDPIELLERQLEVMKAHRKEEEEFYAKVR